jgi:hypothetical protein
VSLADVRLSLLAFPQRFEAGSLTGRVLLLPAVDPTVPSPDLPAFAGTSWGLRTTVLAGVDALFGPGGAATSQVVAFNAAAPAAAGALFDAFKAELKPVAPDAPAVRAARLGGATIRKALPTSYTEAFPFERPGPGTTVGNEFGCGLRDTIPAKDKDPKPPSTFTWGALLSFALRQPLLARALGLIHDFSVPLAPADLLASGGWLYVELNPAGPVKPTPGSVRSYAARLPALAPGDERALFGAVLFPVGLAAAGDYGDALEEAATYDDGFAKVVHAAQAVTADATSGGHNELPPASDAGIDLGWDDEQVTAWLNRQLDALRARLAMPQPGIKVLEAPLGVNGYRVDVRQSAPTKIPASGGWESLCRAFSADALGAAAPLRFPAPPKPAAFSASFQDELAVEPAPVRSRHAEDEVAWLPQHFTRWQGGSLVVNDPTLFQLTGTTPVDANGTPLAVPPPTYRAPAATVPLRYGHEYEFRCRLSDLTGGGPRIEKGDKLRNPAPHPSTRVRFLRHVPPKSVRLDTHIPTEPGKAPTGIPKVASIDVWRPLLGYPEMVFAGAATSAVVASVVAAGQAAQPDGREAVGVNDPDVTHLAVAVQVRAPAHDSGPAATRDGDFRELYRSELPFPAFDPANVLDRGDPLTLTLQYVDVHNVAELEPPAAGATVLPIPRARDVRLRLTPICGDKPDYFGANAKVGLTSFVDTRADAAAETDLFAPLPPEQEEITAILLQPGSDLVQRVAERLRLSSNGLVLASRPGERVFFGASAALRHSIGPDNGSITFAAESELLGHWVIAVQVQLGRDWTWEGLRDEGLVVSRRDAPTALQRVAGQVRVSFSAPATALLGPDVPDDDRRAQTRVVFFDAIDPRPPVDAFPTNPTPRWVIEPRLRGLSGAALARATEIRLPIAVPPRQMPKLLSAGIALSPYQRDPEYSETSQRQRVLWFELDSPPLDPNDAVYARVLAYGPDPLLSGVLTHLLAPTPDVPVGGTTWFDAVRKLLPTPPDPPSLPIDPEPMRVILPGQPEDSSGLDAMVRMVEASPLPGEKQSRHFLVPLPPGLDPAAPELFGFWTYEIRIGHTALWSTAQARFGRPLIVNGVQHPPPPLRCSAARIRPKPDPTVDSRPKIVVVAPHATALFQDRRLTEPRANDPRTRIWALLYAQVVQADGATRRNVLLARAPATPRVDRDAGGTGIPTRDILGVAEFEEDAIAQRLVYLALPPDTPLSVIAVELFPSDHLLQQSVVLGDRTVYFTVDVPDLPASAPVSNSAAGFTPGKGATSDPLGAELGTQTSRRILRCSPLTPIPPTC